MVSLGVPTARFGAPPDPEKPEPHYPGVSALKFDALSALKVYRECVKRGEEIRANQLYLQADREWPVRHRRRVQDLLPGLASVAETYEHLGYTPDPITRRMVLPTAEPPPMLSSSRDASGRSSHHSSRGHSEKLQKPQKGVVLRSSCGAEWSIVLSPRWKPEGMYITCI
ncbi:unnamed protein product [Durusdinium trenchii]|uniref:KIF-binding protein n=1 Tax=Durusdinium trenchii TaxID=1381693 RepID=A0ABP0I4B0_9DINO